MAEVKNWDTIKVNDVDCVKRRVFTGEKAMVAINMIQPGTVTPLHSHPHEQLLWIQQGTCDITLGDKTVPMKAGDIMRVEPDVLHALTVIGNETVINIDIFAPIREDFLKYL
jgi:quercetin dioxygenase-like cupin family protein